MTTHSSSEKYRATHTHTRIIFEEALLFRGEVYSHHSPAVHILGSYRCSLPTSFSSEEPASPILAEFLFLSSSSSQTAACSHRPFEGNQLGNFFPNPLLVRGVMMHENKDVFTVPPNTVQSCGILPPAEQFPNRPILVREDGHVIKIHDSPSSSSSSPNDSVLDDISEYCTPIPIDTDMFVGVAYLLIAGIPGSPTVFFEERQRRLHITVQGRFKQPISFAKVYTGQAWDEKLATTPPVLLEMLLTPILKLLQPGMQINLTGSHPYILSPLASTMQTIHINVPGSEPILPKDIMSLQEDNLHLLGMDTVLTPNARKKFFSVKANLMKYEYDPKYIYTLNFYQHILHIDTFTIFGYDILRVLGRKPIMAMAIIFDPAEPENEGDEVEVAEGKGKRDNSYSHWNFLYKIEMWHERALDL